MNQNEDKFNFGKVVFTTSCKKCLNMNELSICWLNLTKIESKY